MKMIFSSIKPKTVVPVQPKNETRNLHHPTLKATYINPFTNIFSRLQTSGSCSSCG